MGNSPGCWVASATAFPNELETGLGCDSWIPIPNPQVKRLIRCLSTFQLALDQRCYMHQATGFGDLDSIVR